MAKKIVLIILSILLLVNVGFLSFKQPKYYFRAKNYEIVSYDGVEYKITLGLPMYVFDFKSEAWVPYIFSFNSGVYHVRTGFIAADIDTKTGLVTFYDVNYTRMIAVEDIQLAIAGIPQKLVNRQYKAYTNKSGVYITLEAHTISKNVLLTITYAFRVGEGLKHFITVKNLDEKPVNVTVLQIHTFKAEISRIFMGKKQTLNLNMLNTKSLNPSDTCLKFETGNGVLIENQYRAIYNHTSYKPFETQPLKQIQFTGNIVTYVYNHIVGFNNVFKIDPDTSTLNDPVKDGYIEYKRETSCTKSSTFVEHNTAGDDVGFGWSGHYETQSGYRRKVNSTKIRYKLKINPLCLTGLILTHINSKPDNIILAAPGGAGGGSGSLLVYEEYRGYVEWDISTIPDNAEITQVIFKYHGDYRDTVSHTTYIRSMENQPSVSSASTIWADCADGNTYVSSTTFPEAGTNKQIDLGSQACTDLQNHLDDDWFALGFMTSDYCGSDSFETPVDCFYSEDYASADPKPTLEITYTANSPPNIYWESISDTDVYRVTETTNITVKIVDPDGDTISAANISLRDGNGNWQVTNESLTQIGSSNYYYYLYTPPSTAPANNGWDVQIYVKDSNNNENKTLFTDKFNVKNNKPSSGSVSVNSTQISKTDGETVRIYSDPSDTETAKSSLTVKISIQLSDNSWKVTNASMTWSSGDNKWIYDFTPSTSDPDGYCNVKIYVQDGDGGEDNDLFNNVFQITSGGSCSATWWNSNWQYRKSHVIHQASGAGTNYQIRIKVHYGSGADSGENVYLNGHCRTDFGDIRFTDDDCETLLDYWMEEKVDGDYAVFWVEVKDNLSSSDVTICIYYGNSDATTTSNGDNTFIFFDDFENGDFDKWTSHGNWEIVTDIVKQGSKAAYHPGGGTSVERSLKKTITLDYGVMIHVWARTNSSASYAGYPLLTTTSSGTSAYNIVFYDGYLKYYQGSYENWPQNNTYSVNTWYRLQLGYKQFGENGKQKAWRNNDYMGQIDAKDMNGDWVTGLSGFRLVAGSSGRAMWIDVVYIRKYVDPEPTHGGWGNEESNEEPNTIPQCGDQFWLNYSLPGPADIEVNKPVRIYFQPSDAETPFDQLTLNVTIKSIDNLFDGWETIINNASVTQHNSTHYWFDFTPNNTCGGYAKLNVTLLVTDAYGASNQTLFPQVINVINYKRGLNQTLTVNQLTSNPVLNQTTLKYIVTKDYASIMNPLSNCLDYSFANDYCIYELQEATACWINTSSSSNITVTIDNGKLKWYDPDAATGGHVTLHLTLQPAKGILTLLNSSATEVYYQLEVENPFHIEDASLSFTPPMGYNQIQIYLNGNDVTSHVLEEYVKDTSVSLVNLSASSSTYIIRFYNPGGGGSQPPPQGGQAGGQAGQPTPPSTTPQPQGEEEGGGGGLLAVTLILGFIYLLWVEEAGTRKKYGR